MMLVRPSQPLEENSAVYIEGFFMLYKEHHQILQMK